MAAEELWYFAKDHLMNTPSRKCGIDPDKELSYRQQAANFIQDMGQRLNVNQLCINTAIVYMHRFYMFHPFTKFHRNSIATCALFLAAKVEEQPRKLEHVIRVAHMCLHRDDKPLDAKSEAYLERAQELVGNENIMLPTLGFDVAIDHPHTHVVKCCQLVRASKDLAQTSYFMATNSLHLTTMCLQYKPTVVACVCIHLACKWANWEIRRSSEGKDWFWYVDKNVTSELLEELTAEFLAILDKCPSRLKRKIKSATANKSDKDGAGGKKADDPSSTEEYTMADMNQYHDLRIDRADWKEVTRSTKSADKAKSNEERKTVKTEPGLVPPSPQLALKTPSPQKTDQLLPGAETVDNSQAGENCTPSPSVAKKQKLSTPKQSRDKKDAERREVRERERAVAQAKQNVKTEKERSARVSSHNVDAVVASVSAGDVPKMAARPQPAPTQHAAQVSSLNNNNSNNHKQHDAVALERRKAGQFPGPAGDAKENSHANGRHTALGPQLVHTHTQPLQHYDRESDGSAPASGQGPGLEVGGTSNLEPMQPKHKEHHGHGSRNSVVAHHHHFAASTVGKVHSVEAKEKEKAVKQHGRLKTPPAALMEPVHQVGGGGDDHHQHQFLVAHHPVAFVKQDTRVPHQAPVFRSPNGGAGTVDENPVEPTLQHRHNPQVFSGGGDGIEIRAAEKLERKEKHKHKTRTKERSKTRDRDKEHLDPTPVNPNLVHHHHHHQAIKLTIPRDKLGCDDDAVDASLTAVGGGQSLGPLRTAPLAPPPSYHVQQSTPQGHGPSPPIVGLKIKIPKEKLMTTPNANSQNSSVAGAASGGRGGLKITISKARLNAAKEFQVLEAVPRGGNEVTVTPPLPPPPHPLLANPKESRKRAASGKDVGAAKPKVARQTSRSSKGGEQTPLPPVHVAVSDANALASSPQMSMLTPFQASLMNAPEASLRPFQSQGYNQDSTPKMTGTRRGGHSKRGVVPPDNPAPMPNMFHQMNAGPYPYQQYFPHYQNHFFPQPPPDFRYFHRNRPPMPPPLPSGPPPEAPPPPPPPPLHE